MSAAHPATDSAETRSALVRHRLTSAVIESPARLVVVAAPAGYGKTVLLRHVADAARVHVALLAVDEATNDAPALAARIAEELAGVEASSGSDLIIAIDDLHALREPSAASHLDDLIRTAPPGIRFLVAGRANPPLSVAKLRSTGDVVELTREHLAMTEEETRQVFARGGRPVVSPELVHQLWREMEGWPAGLHLAHAAIAAGANPSTAMHEVSREGGAVAGYLMEEVVTRQPTALRGFLRETSILRELHPEICDWVREAEDSAALTAALIDGRLLSPSSATGWTRHYLRLVRTVLVAELNRTGASNRRRLHSRAADWYHRHDDPAAELEHRLQAGERDQAVRVISANAMGLLTSGHLNTVRSWLDQFSDQQIRAAGPLALTAAWVAAFQADLPTALRYAALAEDARWEGPLPDGTTSIASAVAILRSAVCVGSLDEAAAHAQAAIELEGRESPWRPSAHLQLGTISMIASEANVARPHLEHAAMLAGDHQPAVRLSAQGYLALISLTQGDRDSAASQAADIARDIVGRNLDRFPPMAFPIAIAGRIHADAGRVADAERLLLRALELLAAIAFIFPSADAWIRTVIAQGWLAIGDLTRARTTLAEARRLLQRHTFDPRVNMAVSRLEQGLHPTAAGVVQPLTERELEILRMLAAVQSLNQIAEHLVISVNTVKTHVRSIYRKLKVPNRQGALVRARDLGLLAESRVGDRAG